MRILDSNVKVLTSTPFSKDIDLMLGFSIEESYEVINPVIVVRIGFILATITIIISNKNHANYRDNRNDGPNVSLRF